MDKVQLNLPLSLVKVLLNALDLTLAMARNANAAQLEMIEAVLGSLKVIINARVLDSVSRDTAYAFFMEMEMDDTLSSLATQTRQEER